MLRLVTIRGISHLRHDQHQIPASRLAYSLEAFSKYQPTQHAIFQLDAEKLTPEHFTIFETSLTDHLIDEFDRLIRRDPGRRGLISTESEYGKLCDGHLKSAARHLAQHGTAAAIVTGFFIPRADPPAAETDGPIGALTLACLLEKVGIDTCVITDCHCLSAIQAAAEFLNYAAEQVLECHDPGLPWCQEFFESEFGRRLSHLIAIERVGPSHILESLIAQSRYDDPPVEEFEQQVSVSARGHSHNMKGVVIDEHTAELHHLFEIVKTAKPDVRTIGIGDGGNEIGMGTIPWEELARRLPGESAGRIACRIATDWTIIAGTSNWGGYALTAAVLSLLEQTELAQGWDQDHQLKFLQHIVEHGPAVDGITALAEATVDALPFATYIQPWDSMRRLMGLNRG